MANCVLSRDLTLTPDTANGGLVNELFCNAPPPSLSQRQDNPIAPKRVSWGAMQLRSKSVRPPSRPTPCFAGDACTARGRRSIRPQRPQRRRLARKAEGLGWKCHCSVYIGCCLPQWEGRPGFNNILLQTLFTSCYCCDSLTTPLFHAVPFSPEVLRVTRFLVHAVVNPSLRSFLTTFQGTPLMATSLRIKVG